MTIVSGQKQIKARGRCLIWIKSSERLAKINDSSIIMLWLYVCGKNQRLLCRSLLHQKGLCVHTPQHRMLPSTSKISGRFPKTHLQRDILPSHACRAPSSGCAKTRWKYQPSTETWMHHGDFETRVCMQWDGTVDAWCVLKETDTGGKRKITDFSQKKWSRKKISYRFYKWKLGTSLGQTISEWNTWPIARDKMTDSALLDQTWKHKKGKHKQDKLREMKYIY